jgi:hypothetical protein
VKLIQNSRPRVKRWTTVNMVIKDRALQLVDNLDLLNGDAFCIQLDNAEQKLETTYTEK